MIAQACHNKEDEEGGNDLEIEGYVQKKNTKGYHNSRYFATEGQYLRYWTDKNSYDQKEKESFTYNIAQVGRLSSTANNRSFTLFFMNDAFKLELKANSSELFFEWTEMLKAKIALYSRDELLSMINLRKLSFRTKTFQSLMILEEKDQNKFILDRLDDIFETYDENKLQSVREKDPSALLKSCQLCVEEMISTCEECALEVRQRDPKVIAHCRSFMHRYAAILKGRISLEMLAVLTSSRGLSHASSANAKNLEMLGETSLCIAIGFIERLEGLKKYDFIPKDFVSVLTSTLFSSGELISALLSLALVRIDALFDNTRSSPPRQRANALRDFQFIASNSLLLLTELPDNLLPMLMVKLLTSQLLGFADQISEMTFEDYDEESCIAHIAACEHIMLFFSSAIIDVTNRRIVDTRYMLPTAASASMSASAVQRDGDLNTNILTSVHARLVPSAVTARIGSNDDAADDDDEEGVTGEIALVKLVDGANPPIGMLRNQKKDIGQQQQQRQEQSKQQQQQQRGALSSPVCISLSKDAVSALKFSCEDSIRKSTVSVVLASDHGINRLCDNLFVETTLGWVGGGLCSAIIDRLDAWLSAISPHIPPAYLPVLQAELSQFLVVTYFARLMARYHSHKGVRLSGKGMQQVDADLTMIHSWVIRITNTEGPCSHTGARAGAGISTSVGTTLKMTSGGKGTSRGEDSSDFCISSTSVSMQSEGVKSGEQEKKLAIDTTAGTTGTASTSTSTIVGGSSTHTSLNHRSPSIVEDELLLLAGMLNIHQCSEAYALEHYAHLCEQLDGRHMNEVYDLSRLVLKFRSDLSPSARKRILGSLVQYCIEMQEMSLSSSSSCTSSSFSRYALSTTTRGSFISRNGSTGSDSLNGGSRTGPNRNNIDLNVRGQEGRRGNLFKHDYYSAGISRSSSNGNSNGSSGGSSNSSCSDSAPFLFNGNESLNTGTDYCPTGVEEHPTASSSSSRGSANNSKRVTSRSVFAVLCPNSRRTFCTGKKWVLEQLSEADMSQCQLTIATQVTKSFSVMHTSATSTPGTTTAAMSPPCYRNKNSSISTSISSGPTKTATKTAAATATATANATSTVEPHSGPDGAYASDSDTPVELDIGSSSSAASCNSTAPAAAAAAARSVFPTPSRRPSLGIANKRFKPIPVSAVTADTTTSTTSTTATAIVTAASSSTSSSPNPAIRGRVGGRGGEGTIASASASGNGGTEANAISTTVLSPSALPALPPPALSTTPSPFSAMNSSTIDGVHAEVDVDVDVDNGADVFDLVDQINMVNNQQMNGVILSDIRDNYQDPSSIPDGLSVASGADSISVQEPEQQQQQQRQQQRRGRPPPPNDLRSFARKATTKEAVEQGTSDLIEEELVKTTTGIITENSSIIAATAAVSVPVPVNVCNTGRGDHGNSTSTSSSSEGEGKTDKDNEKKEDSATARRPPPGRPPPPPMPPPLPPSMRPTTTTAAPIVAAANSDIIVDPDETPNNNQSHNTNSGNDSVVFVADDQLIPANENRSALSVVVNAAATATANNANNNANNAADVADTDAAIVRPPPKPPKRPSVVKS